MKKENFFNAIGKVDENLLEESFSEQDHRMKVSEKNSQAQMKVSKRRKFPWYIVGIAAALVLVFAIQSLWPGENIPGASKPLHALTFAEYPALEKLSEDHDERDFERWMQSQEALFALREGVDYKPYEAFFKRVNESLLSSRENKNFVYSPLNLYLASSLLAEITGGESREEVLAMLGVNSIEDLRENAKRLWVDNYQDDGNYTSLLANSFWLREGDEDYKEDTLEHLAKDYFASAFQGKMGSEEYNEQFREWINTQTKDLLKDSVGQLSLEPETVMALVSTIYYQNSWEEIFEESQNTNDVFKAAEGDLDVEYMHAKVNADAYLGESFTASSLPYASGGKMVFIKANEGEQIEDALSSEEFQNFISTGIPSMRFAEIQYQVPKFDVSSDIDFIETMSELGIASVFDSARSDFSNLKENYKGLAVDTFQHAARVKINEEGTEAAAYTMIAVNETAAEIPEETIEMVLDEAFAFALVNDANQVLFFGVVENPLG